MAEEAKGQELQSWKTLSRRVLLDHGKFLVVEEHTVELADGQIIHDWPWLITPDYINVVAVTRDGLFLSFRQTKYGIEGTSLAPVGGYLEQGEDPLAAAQRELLEETGYQAEDWTELGHYRVDGNRGVGMANYFLARQAHQVTEPDADDLEQQEMVLLTREQMEAALDAGAFKTLPWAAIVALALRRMEG